MILTFSKNSQIYGCNWSLFREYIYIKLVIIIVHDRDINSLE